MANSTRNERITDASQRSVYDAFTDPKALAIWLAPGDMTGEVRNFDLRVGGGYEMSLYYPESDKESRGKTSKNEDRLKTRFVELSPPERIVEAVTFESDDEAFSGEMMMDVTLRPNSGGTKVIISFTNIPPGIRPEDNEKGTEMSLNNLEKYLREEAG